MFSELMAEEISLDTEFKAFSSQSLMKSKPLSVKDRRNRASNAANNMPHPACADRGARPQ